MARLPAHRPAVCPLVKLSPVTEAYDGTSDIFDVVGQLVESTELFDISLVEEAVLAAVEVDDDLVCVVDLETEVPRLFEIGLSVEILVVVEIEDVEEVGQLLFFPPLVEVPRDFFVGGSSRVLFIEFKLPWDGLLLFSLLERLLDAPVVVDSDWLDGVGKLFTGALRRRPIVIALAILCVFTCRNRAVHRYSATNTSTLPSTL